MAMGAHGYQIASLLFHPLHDFSGRVAVGEVGFSGNSFGLKFCSDFLQIGGIFGNFRTDRVFAVGSGSPSVGYVKKDEAAVRKLREFFDMFDDGAVGWRAVEGY
jgi:hypothetical protein